MIRLGRASVIAALSLLAWAATASAECAWALWEEQTFTTLGAAGSVQRSSPTQWLTLVALASQEKCVREQTRSTRLAATITADKPDHSGKLHGGTCDKRERWHRRGHDGGKDQGEKGGVNGQLYSMSSLWTST